MIAGCWVLAIFSIGVTGSCISPSPLVLQMILDYAQWRTWEEVVLFDDLNSTNCAIKYARPLIQCFGERGMKVSIQSSINPGLPEALKIQRHRVGAVVLLDGLNLTSIENVLHVASQKQLFNYYVSWFMITARKVDTIIDSVLRHLPIGLDSDVVVGTSYLNHSDAKEMTGRYLNRTCAALRRYGSTFEFQPMPRRKEDENSTMNLQYVILENRTMSFYLTHVYKIRIPDNSSLVVDDLGSWNPGSYSLRFPVSVKLRNNFGGLPIVVGVLNGSNDGQAEVTEEDDTQGVVPLMDIMTFVANSMNASMEMVPHEKLGTVTNKAWSNLLGDVVSGTVDIGLGYITTTDERQREMSFTHPLIRYMRNIYFHPPESGTMRDIFLQPFNDKLLLGVAMTYVFIVFAMGAINYASKTVFQDGGENAGLGEAALWCISIMCMQGSPWTPRNPSGKTVLLASLIFALVTYNAYAGFITSILSVQASGIKTLSDLLQNNFKFGYSVSDDEYIRNANDSNLRQLYIKAFNSRESQLDTTLGLKRAVKGGYSFFVSATLARRALRTSLIQDRCSLSELVIPQTFTVVALPMANTCPYKKIINLSIMRIRERGVLDRILHRMMPSMPKCYTPTTFHSARLADVYSAIVILAIGVVMSFFIGIIERLWYKRRRLRERILRGVRLYQKRARLHPQKHPEGTLNGWRDRLYVDKDNPDEDPYQEGTNRENQNTLHRRRKLPVWKRSNASQKENRNSSGNSVNRSKETFVTSFSRHKTKKEDIHNPEISVDNSKTHESDVIPFQH
ncbi:uncharacterized protein LOC105697490 [Orussus abietinus]|uniref:uncharacterized protein LOC105697490 n=1 Tax=Orussus abietinus TaxID=222816 RepID=UPI000C716032|nr:uncharacterized protein LOC105697490 [Orussus abietinus]